MVCNQSRRVLNFLASLVCCFWQLMRCDCVKTQEADNLDSAPFSPSSPREKWLRRRTHVKLRVNKPCFVIANGTSFLSLCGRCKLNAAAAQLSLIQVLSIDS